MLRNSYVNAPLGKISERRIRVLVIQKRYIMAYCYLRGDTRGFRKKGMLSIFRCQTI